MKIMLINLDRSKDRLKLMEKRLKALGLSFERVPAVDGSLADLTKTPVHAPNWRYPHQLTKGEIGCLLSHRKCWQRLVDSDERFGLILEDDIVFHPEARRYFLNSDWIPEGVSLVQFSFSRDKTFSDGQIDLADGNQLVRVKCSSPCGTYAYIISREAAEQALADTSALAGPADNVLFGQYFNFPKKVRFWRLKRCVVNYIDDVPTTISGRGPKHKSPLFYRMHPNRLLAKFKMKQERTKLHEVKQEWFDDQSPLIQ
jgi:glycosyl transferase family 25